MEGPLSVSVLFFDLVGLPGAQGPDQQADDEKRARRQQHQAVGQIPAAFVGGRQDRIAEQFAGAEQFAAEAHQQQNQPVAEAVADAIEEAQARRVFHGEGFGAAEHDAVGDDQADENRQLLADAESEGLQELVDDNHQGGDDGDLDDDPDIGRDLPADQADGHVRARDDENHRQAHGYHRRHFRGDGQRRADAEDLQADGIAVEDGIE